MKRPINFLLVACFFHHAVIASNSIEINVENTTDEIFEFVGAEYGSESSITVTPTVLKPGEKAVIMGTASLGSNLSATLSFRNGAVLTMLVADMQAYRPPIFSLSSPTAFIADKLGKTWNPDLAINKFGLQYIKASLVIFRKNTY